MQRTDLERKRDAVSAGVNGTRSSSSCNSRTVSCWRNGCRRRSPAKDRQEHTFAEKMLSAMRQKFGGHLEPGTSTAEKKTA